jgi:hypothetical protein
MARHDALRDKGYVRLPGSARHYRAPDGREVTYRAAFTAATGRSFEAAVKDPGKFRAEYNLARQARDAARRGELSGSKLATKDEERAISKATLRELTRGHGLSAGTKAGLSGKGKAKPTAYSRRVLDILHREGGNSPNGKKARLLVALGRREPDADYDVGETP